MKSMFKAHQSALLASELCAVHNFSAVQWSYLRKCAVVQLPLVCRHTHANFSPVHCLTAVRQPSLAELIRYCRSSADTQWQCSSAVLLPEQQKECREREGGPCSVLSTCSGAQYTGTLFLLRYTLPTQVHCTCSGTLYLLRCTVTERGRPCELTAPESRRSLISQPKYSERQPNISSVNINQGLHQTHYVPESTFATLCPY